MGFVSFLVLLGIAYLIWRVTDQLPDLIFRLSEVQRDVAEIRRRMTEEEQAEPFSAAQTDKPVGESSDSATGF